MPVYDTPLHTNDQSLDRVLQAGLPVALILWDSRRGLDRALEDQINQVAKTESGKLLIAKLDTSGNPQTASRWSGVELPALALYRGGTPVLDAARPLTDGKFRAYIDHLLERGLLPQNGADSIRNENGASDQAASARPELTRPVAVTDATFQREVLESDVPVVVDFWAAWCGPCRMIAPTLEKLAAEYGGRLKIAKVDVDQNHRYAGQYGVQGIPTLLLVKNGKIADRIVGAMPEKPLRQKIAAFVR